MARLSPSACSRPMDTASGRFEIVSKPHLSEGMDENESTTVSEAAMQLGVKPAGVRVMTTDYPHPTSFGRPPSPSYVRDRASC
jgi:hypothetical protein